MARARDGWTSSPTRDASRWCASGSPSEPEVALSVARAMGRWLPITGILLVAVGASWVTSSSPPDRSSVAVSVEPVAEPIEAAQPMLAIDPRARSVEPLHEDGRRLVLLRVQE